MKVQQTKTGQLVITIPRQLAQAIGIKKGSNVNFSVVSKNRLELQLGELNG
jgi:antitoxin component of MazEF toxin-antitoxin module